MKSHLPAAFLVGTLALALSTSAHATLIDRGGGLIYDNALDITWLQDANYAKTSGYPTAFAGNGRMQWGNIRGEPGPHPVGTALAWAEQLVYGGYDDWRLPTLAPINGINFTRGYTTNGSTDYARNISYPGNPADPTDPASAHPNSTQNELAYMFYVNLGNLANVTTDGTQRSGTTGINFGLTNSSFVDGLTGKTVSFQNVQNHAYWPNIEPWAFLTLNGFNDITGKGNYYFAWAVRDGDVASTAVPEPATLLLGAGLAGFGLIRGRSRQARY